MTQTILRDLHLDEAAAAGPGSPNFFNGRLLTGEDLAAEQASGLAADLELGRIAGPGVAHGLTVTRFDAGAGAGGVPRIQIGAGGAVTPSGRVLALAAATRLELRRTPPPQGAIVSAFAQCMPAGPTPAGHAQLHLLTIGPAPAAALGRAPVVSLSDEPAACAVDRLAAAVRLRLRPFAVPLPPGPAVRLRSFVASLLLGDLGTDEALLADEPLLPARGGLLEVLRGSCFDTEEIPLAVVRWPSASAGVEFVDQWAARRRCVQPGTQGETHMLTTDAARARAEARLSGVQDHLAELVARGTATGLVARDRFMTLPPAFVLPLRGPQSPAGFDATAFLSGLTARRDAWVEGARVGELLAAASTHPAVDVTAAQPEALWRYAIRPRRRPFGTPTHLLLVSGHVRYAANAQYDLAHYDQANYAVQTI